MSKPPKTPPHSDLDGIHEDETRNIDSAIAAGQGSKDLQRAKEETIGRPPSPNVDEEPEKDRA